MTSIDEHPDEHYCFNCKKFVHWTSLSKCDDCVAKMGGWCSKVEKQAVAMAEKDMKAVAGYVKAYMVPALDAWQANTVTQLKQAVQNAVEQAVSVNLRNLETKILSAANAVEEVDEKENSAASLRVDTGRNMHHSMMSTPEAVSAISVNSIIASEPGSAPQTVPARTYE